MHVFQKAGRDKNNKAYRGPVSSSVAQGHTVGTKEVKCMNTFPYP